MEDVVILIPAYNPTTNLLKLVDELLANNFSRIMIVNDGSLKKSQKVFNKLKELDECIVLEYKDNKGKGYALKYGINYYLENLKNNYKGIVTVDADLQHLPSDILNISLKLIGNQDSLILGTRNFDLKDIPSSNKFGNKITSVIFGLLYGKRIKDTQTGLRGIPNRYLHLALEASGKRFEYETNMLIKFVREKISILEVDIQTVYYSVSESKFNKFIDSFRIYKVLFTEYFKFLCSSLTCYTVDIVLFTLLFNLFNTIDSNIRIVMSTVLARLVADFLNFNINKNFVFNSHEQSKNLLFKYYLLSFSKMICSACLVLIIHNIFNMVNETLLKMIVDSFIYVISYKIQKKYIFKT